MKPNFSRGLLAVSLLVVGTSLRAQSVIVSSPTPTVTPSSLRDTSGPSLDFLYGGLITDLRPLQLGPLLLRPHIFDSFTNADGLQSRRGVAENTNINSFSPGIFADIGSHWTVDYTPTWRNYSNPDFTDSLEHHLTIAGGQAVGDWLVQFYQGYYFSDSSNIDTGIQNSRETFTTKLDASHRLNSRVSLDIGLAQNLQYIKGFTNSFDWSTSEWVNYQIAYRMDVAAGVQVGYTDFDPGSSAFYYTPQARFRWQFTDKLSASAHAGLEHRQVHGTGIPDQNVPIYGAAITYQPFTYTGLSAAVDRSVAPAYYENSTSQSTRWTATLGQRLLGRYFLSATYSGSNVHYIGTGTILVPQSSTQNVLDGSGNVIGTITTTTLVPTQVVTRRNDTYYSLGLRLSTKILQHGSFAVIYRTNHNDSDTNTFTLSTREVGCEVGYRF